MGGGKYDYADAYGKYKAGEVSDADFEKYVDSQGDLKDAWSQIQSQPEGTQGSYWIPRGATSKAAFGRAHAAEDQALRTGSYQGGTDVRKGTDAYKDYFDSKDTRFTQYIQDPNRGNGNGNGNGTTSTWAAATGGGAPGSAMYPMGLVDYTAPDAMTGVSSELQPWLQPNHIPDSLWSYQPPTLNEWELQRDWDWATKPASEYGPQPVAPAVTTGNGYGPEGGTGDAPPGGWGSGEGFGLIDDITQAYNNAKMMEVLSGLETGNTSGGGWVNPNVNVDDGGWTVG